MPVLSRSLAAAIRRTREAAGFSQEQLAERASLHRTYISMVERAQRNISVDALDRIATAMDTSASRLLSQAERARAAEKR